MLHDYFALWTQFLSSVFVVPGYLALLGANLLIARYNGPDARGGEEVWHRGQLLERDHDRSCKHYHSNQPTEC